MILGMYGSLLECNRTEVILQPASCLRGVNGFSVSVMKMSNRAGGKLTGLRGSAQNSFRFALH